MSVLMVVAAIAVMALVIGRQVLGTAVSGRRLIVLPAILTIIGIVDLSGPQMHPGVTDLALLALGALIAIGTGVGLGLMTRIERRDGHLWTQLPLRGLALWATLIASRIAIGALAHAAGAHVAAATGAILLTLGLNRAAQALVIVPRAVAAGIPFAPDRNGRVLGAAWFADA